MPFTVSPSNVVASVLSAVYPDSDRCGNRYGDGIGLSTSGSLTLRLLYTRLRLSWLAANMHKSEGAAAVVAPSHAHPSMAVAADGDRWGSWRRSSTPTTPVVAALAPSSAVADASPPSPQSLQELVSSLNHAVAALKQKAAASSDDHEQQRLQQLLEMLGQLLTVWVVQFAPGLERLVPSLPTPPPPLHNFLSALDDDVCGGTATTSWMTDGWSDDDAAASTSNVVGTSSSSSQTTRTSTNTAARRVDPNSGVATAVNSLSSPSSSSHPHVQDHVLLMLLVALQGVLMHASLAEEEEEVEDGTAAVVSGIKPPGSEPSTTVVVDLRIVTLVLLSAIAKQCGERIVSNPAMLSVFVAVSESAAVHHTNSSTTSGGQRHTVAAWIGATGNPRTSAVATAAMMLLLHRAAQVLSLAAVEPPQRPQAGQPPPRLTSAMGSSNLSTRLGGMLLQLHMAARRGLLLSTTTMASAATNDSHAKADWYRLAAALVVVTPYAKCPTSASVMACDIVGGSAMLASLSPPSEGSPAVSRRLQAACFLVSHACRCRPLSFVSGGTLVSGVTSDAPASQQGHTAAVIGKRQAASSRAAGSGSGGSAGVGSVLSYGGGGESLMRLFLRPNTTVAVVSTTAAGGGGGTSVSNTKSSCVTSAKKKSATSAAQLQHQTQPAALTATCLLSRLIDTLPNVEAWRCVFDVARSSWTSPALASQPHMVALLVSHASATADTFCTALSADPEKTPSTLFASLDAALRTCMHLSGLSWEAFDGTSNAAPTTEDANVSPSETAVKGLLQPGQRQVVVALYAKVLSCVLAASSAADGALLLLPNSVEETNDVAARRLAAALRRSNLRCTLARCLGQLPEASVQRLPLCLVGDREMAETCHDRMEQLCSSELPLAEALVPSPSPSAATIGASSLLCRNAIVRFVLVDHLGSVSKWAQHATSRSASPLTSSPMSCSLATGYWKETTDICQAVGIWTLRCPSLATFQPAFLHAVTNAAMWPSDATSGASPSALVAVVWSTWAAAQVKCGFALGNLCVNVAHVAENANSKTSSSSRLCRHAQQTTTTTTSAEGMWQSNDAYVMQLAVAALDLRRITQACRSRFGIGAGTPTTLLSGHLVRMLHNLLKGVGEHRLLFELRDHPEGLANAFLHQLTEFAAVPIPAGTSAAASSNAAHVVARRSQQQQQPYWDVKARWNAMFAIGEVVSRSDVYLADPPESRRCVRRLLEGILHDTNFKVRSRAAAALWKILQTNRDFVSHDVTSPQPEKQQAAAHEAAEASDDDSDEDDAFIRRTMLPTVPLLSAVLSALQQNVAIVHVSSSSTGANEKEVAATTESLVAIARMLLEVAPCTAAVQKLMTEHKALLNERHILC